jgi:Tfp pilus assembly PilM family ATPase/Tfp pilus assembly protein PilN
MSVRVALEIGKQYIKMVMVKSQGGQSGLFDCIVVPIPSFSDEQIAQTIADIFRREKIRVKSVVVCLSRDSVTIRNLHLPSRDAGELNQMIDLHIARVVPYKKGEIVYTYQSLGADEMGYTRVVLAIAHIDVIGRQDKILEKAGLIIDRISLSSYGIWQWVLKTCSSEIKQNELYMLLDFDSTFTDFIVFSQQNLFLTRGIPIGAKAIEEMKQVGLTKLLGEVKQSLIVFYKEEINTKVEKIFISGFSIPEHFYKIIENELGIPVSPVPLTYSPQMLNVRKRTIPGDISLTGISELILEENKQVISFVLPQIQIRKSIREKVKDLIILGSFSIYLFSLICAIFLVRIYNQQSYLTKLDQSLDQISKEIGDLIAQSKKIEFTKDYLANRRLPLIIIYQLQRLIPEEVAIDFISIDEKNSISLRGQAFQLSNVFNFINAIEKSNYFKDVQTKYTRKKKLRDREITDFEVAFQLAL